MQGIREAKCFSCKHLKIIPSLKGFTCKAFPNGIPSKILDEGFDHSLPFPDDNGIRYEYDREIEGYYAT